MTDIPRRRKERKYNLSNVSKIQDIPPQSEFILQETLYHPDRNHLHPEKEWRSELGNTNSEIQLNPSLAQDSNKQITFSALSPQDDAHANQSKQSMSSSPTTQGLDHLETPAFKPAERDITRTKDLHLGGCSPIPEAERESFDIDSAKKVPPRGGIQKATMDTPNVTPTISINKAEVDDTISSQEERLERMRKQLEQTFGANPTNQKLTTSSISEKALEESVDLQPNAIKLSNAFSFQDSPTNQSLSKPQSGQVAENGSKIAPQLVQQATFGINPADSELLQSYRSAQSRDNSENSRVNRSGQIEENLPQSTFATQRSPEKSSLERLPNEDQVEPMLELPLKHSNSDQANQAGHHRLKIPSQNSSPRSPEMADSNNGEKQQGIPRVDYQVSFQTSPNLNSVGLFNKVSSQPVIDLKVAHHTSIKKTDSAEDTKFVKQDTTQSPAHTAKSMTHPVLQTHASLPAKTPVSPEDKSPSIAPSERDISRKESKSVRGGAENRTGGNIQKMKQMLDHSLRSGGVSKRSGSFIDIDDAKSAKSHINEDKMKRRIKEQFPTNDAFLENASGKSMDLNDQQANYTQKVKNNQIIDDKMLRNKIARGEGQINIHHHHHSHNEPAVLKTLENRRTPESEKPLFSNIYPRLALVMVSMLFIEILRKALGY